MPHRFKFKSMITVCPTPNNEQRTVHALYIYICQLTVEKSCKHTRLQFLQL